MTNRPRKTIIRVLSGPSPTQTGVNEAVLGGAASPISALSKAADLMPLDADQLKGFLHFRLATAKAAADRAGWFGGRLYNAVSGESPDYIPLSGTHLRQAFIAMRIEPPEFIIAGGEYELRVDYAQKALAALHEAKEQK